MGKSSSNVMRTKKEQMPSRVKPRPALAPCRVKPDCKTPAAGARTERDSSGVRVGDGTLHHMVEQGRKLVTIFGGSGFIGTQLTQELARRGYAVRVAVRRPDLAGHVRMFGFPGQVQPVQANLRFPDSIAAAMRGSDVVINLVGIAYEKGRQRFGAVHIQGARTVAVAARAAEVTTLIHMSALGAEPRSASAYMRAKALGEA